MAGPAMTYSLVDYADVQGLVRFGYGHMTSASYATRARQRRGFGESLVARGSGHECGCEQKPPPTTALQIAFTHPGLTKPRLPEPVMKGFSREFHHGMSSKSYRRRFLGDVKNNDLRALVLGRPRKRITSPRDVFRRTRILRFFCPKHQG